MPDEHPIATATRSSNGGKNTLTERKPPVMAMEVPPDKEARDMPVALIVKDWLTGTHAHYERMSEELTMTWARKILNLEEQRLAYMKRMLEALLK